MQFNLRFLFAATTCAGIATYALIYATPFWAAMCFTPCIGLLLAAIVFAIAASGKSRFFWLGFAIFGWGYWLVLHSPILSMGPAAQNWRLNAENGPPFLTTRYLIWVYNAVLPLVHEQPEPQPAPPPVVLTIPPSASGGFAEPPRDAFGYAVRKYSYPTEIEFMRVGHSLCDLLFALLGGLVGSFAHWQFRRKQQSAP